MNDEIENLANIYWERLKSGNPAITLINFYCDMYKLPFNKDFIPFFARLVKIFGREMVYLSILDTGTVRELKHEEIYRLLYYFCQKRIEEKTIISQYADLTDQIKLLTKRTDKAVRARLDVKEPFDNE